MLHLAGLTAVLLAAAAGAEHPVNGRLVAASTGNPVAGADILVVDQPGVVRTDAEGRFSWTVAPPLPALVLAVLPDGRASRPVLVRHLDSAADLVLRVDIGMGEAVVVPGAAPGIETAPGAAATLLTATDVALRDPSTLTETLDVIPGVDTVGEGRSAVPAIRGLARGRTLIVVDGARATTERRAGANAAFLDPAIARTIEIARGPGSVAYGSDAFGGIIAVSTRRPDPAKGYQFQVSGAAGGGVPSWRGDIEATRGHGSGGVLMSVRTRRFGDYTSPEGRIANSQWRDRGVRFGWDQTAGAHAWSVAWQTDLARDIGHPRSDGDIIRANTPFDDTHRLTLSYRRPFVGPFTGVRVDGGAGRARHRTDQDRLATTTRPRQIDGTALSYRDLQLRVAADHLAGKARVHIGADLERRSGLHAIDSMVTYNLTGALVADTTSVSIDSAERTSGGVFGEVSMQPARWIGAAAGLRAAGVRSTNSGGHFGDVSVTNTAIAGQGAVTVVPGGGVTLVAQVARGFREPTLSDRFYRGPVGRGFIEGNPALRPESSVQFDLSVRYQNGPLRLTTAGYRYRLSDLIERYAAGPTLFLFRNRGRGDLTGLEVEAQVGLPAGFTLAGSFETSRGRDPFDGTPLDDVAPAGGSVTVRHAAGPRFTSFLRAAHVGARMNPGPGEVPTRDHTLLDAGVKWTIGPRIGVLVSAANLLDASYESSAGPRWVLAPGRRMSVTLVLRHAPSVR